MQKTPEQSTPELNQPSPIFNFQKISKFISNLQRQITHIRTLCKKISKNNQTSSQDIIKIMQHKNQVLQLYTDQDKQRQRYFKKQLNNIDFLLLQKQQYEANEIWIKNNVDIWIQVNLRVLQDLTDRAKKVQLKRMNKMLKGQQIMQFKADLIKTTAQHRKAIQEMIRSLCQWNAKNCCALIENLTTNMQQIKISQKKRQNRKAQNQKKKAK